ncbi:sulfotransferase [Desulfobotulus sp. H1]|uniref:Sulfotransferase n=1 Tax=Desulfobotulus pelophilus TaxID=2823377 RepID=A0ABT3NCV9_9BACT|nr:sulfotransferase [Desulfobotulus pelophilus]MCW7755283.1 sulfotransferase [Desulfobotulus pelophilus]
MSIHSQYFTYLKHFCSTVTLNEFHEKPTEQNLIALRHDVDHDLDLALEMSYWEYRHGFRSTYFILPHSGYWGDSRNTLDKILQIQDFGHEIGLHVNTIAEWFKGICDCPAKGLEDVLQLLRGFGIQIQGMAIHGDKVCYEKQFLNSWLFQELKPDNPAKTETDKSAEGIYTNDPRFQIRYPDNEILVREDGGSLPLWSVSMANYGLEYHAVHLHYDRYFTDSGGTWKRSPDPLQENLSDGRHQVLIHPEYWKGPQRIYFFLSAARSGSKWLSTVLNEASSLECTHEFTLNHCYKNQKFVEDHHTGPGFVSFLCQKDKIQSLLLDSRTWIDESGGDYGEANVYLESVFPELKNTFPDAHFVHLYRNPSDVVRSLINRSWYDLPEDDRHPVATDKENWQHLSQFEKTCWYVRSVNERLFQLNLKICFEEMVSDRVCMERIMMGLGIPFYPRLAEKYFRQKINESRDTKFPHYGLWTFNLKETFDGICGETAKKLGYVLQRGKPFAFECTPVGDSSSLTEMEQFLSKPAQESFSESLAVMDFSDKNLLEMLYYRFCTIKYTGENILIVPERDRNSYLLFGGGEWSHISETAGWQPEPAHYYKGSLRIQIEGEGNARLFCLEYGQDGMLKEKKVLQLIKPGQSDYDFAFRVKPNSMRFDLALHFGKEKTSSVYTIVCFSLISVLA